MVYDWESKEEICYRLYIEEKKSLEEIMEFMKENYKFAPRYGTPFLQDLQLGPSLSPILSRSAT